MAVDPAAPLPPDSMLVGARHHTPRPRGVRFLSSTRRITRLWPNIALGGRRGAMKYVPGSNISSTYGSRCGALGVVFWRTRAGWLRTLGVPRVPAYRVCMHSMGSGGAARDRHAGQSDGRVLRPRLTDCLRCGRNAVGTSWWRSLVQSPLHSTHRRRFWRCWRR